LRQKLGIKLDMYGTSEGRRRGIDGGADRPHLVAMPRGLERFSEDASKQVHFFETRGVPVYAPLLSSLARLAQEDELVRSALLEAWGEREFTSVYDRPLLLLASIRKDALADPAHPLARALRATDPDASPVPDEALRAALAPGRPARASLRARFVQTNEVTRAIAWRLPLAALQGARDVTLVDLGCSAGLNLVADRLDSSWLDQDDRVIPLPPAGVVARRIGLDRAPIDARDPEEREWLRACLWPGQSERHERLDRALALAARALDAGEMTLEALDASAMPARLEELAADGGRVLAYQTVFSGYMPDEARDAYLAGMRAFVARHAGRAIWTELETAPKGAPGPAELRVHTHSGTNVVFSCEYHPTRCVLRR
jgi:hypothetical protein